MEKITKINKAEDFKTEYKLYATGMIAINSETKNKNKWIKIPEIRLTPNQVREISIIYRRHVQIREGTEKLTKWEQLLKKLTRK